MLCPKKPPTVTAEEAPPPPTATLVASAVPTPPIARFQVCDAVGVAMDAAGNTYLVGRMSGAGAQVLAGLASTGTGDMFLARYDATG